MGVLSDWEDRILEHVPWSDPDPTAGSGLRRIAYEMRALITEQRRVVRAADCADVAQCARIARNWASGLEGFPVDWVVASVLAREAGRGLKELA